MCGAYVLIFLTISPSTSVHSCWNFEAQQPEWFIAKKAGTGTKLKQRDGRGWSYPLKTLVGWSLAFTLLPWTDIFAIQLFFCIVSKTRLAMLSGGHRICFCLVSHILPFEFVQKWGIPLNWGSISENMMINDGLLIFLHLDRPMTSYVDAATVDWQFWPIMYIQLALLRWWSLLRHYRDTETTKLTRRYGMIWGFLKMVLPKNHGFQY